MITSLRVRILMLVILAVLPAFGLLLYTVSEERNKVARKAHDDALRLVQLVARDQEHLIDGAHQLLAVTAQLPEVRSSNESCNQLFAHLLEQNPGYTNIAMIKPDGEVLYSVIPIDKTINVTDRTYFQRVLESRTFAMGDYLIGRVTGKPTLPFAYPVLSDAGQLQAVLYAGLDLSWLNLQDAGATLPPGATITLRDQNGTILARHPDGEKWLGKSYPHAPIARAMFNAQGEGTVESTGVDGINRLYAFKPLPSAPEGEGVYISVGIPTEVAFADVNKMLARNLTWLGLAATLVLIIAWFGSYYFLLRQLKALLIATKQLAGGDLSARSGLSYGRGELRQLAFAFDEMAATIEKQSLQLHQAEARYRALVENVPTVIYTICADKVGTVLYVGPQIESLLGFTPIELTSDPELWSKQIHPADRQRIRAGFYQALNNFEPFSYEYRIYTRDGRELWVHDKADIVQDESGHPSYFQGFLFDISDRKLAEEATKLAYSELSQIFNTAADGLCVIDKEFNVLRVNDALLILLGASKEAAVGKKCYEVYPSPKCHSSSCSLKRILGSESRIEFDVEKQKNDGSIFHCIVTATRYTDPAGQIIGLVVNLKDISQRKQLEKEMAQLERLNLVGEMAAGIGHEIRNPMTTVRGLLQILGSKKECLEYIAYFDLMIGELDRANSIITEFLSLTKTSGTDLKQQSLNTIIETLYPLLQADAMNDYKEVKVELGEIPDLPLNEKEIRQLILNLVRNGLEAMNQGGYLLIKTFISGDKVFLAVQDQGEGIDGDVLGKLGTPFFTTKDTGTGLGLAVCYNIAARHNASIEVETNPTGTTFYVQFKAPPPSIT